MSRGNPRDRSKERFWRRAVRHWRRSGLTIREFCRQEQLSEGNFYAWRTTIGQRDAEKLAFVPVQVVSEPIPAAPSGESAGLELILGNGRRLRIGRSFDAATLQRLLALIEGSRS